MVGIAQLVSASDCGSEGRGFESLYPPSRARDVFSYGKRSVLFQFLDRFDKLGKTERNVKTESMNRVIIMRYLPY